MRTSSPLLLLGALGALSGPVGSAAAAVDTSQWKCESCPFETGASGHVDVGVGAVSDGAAKFGDYTGLDRNAAFAIAGGAVRYRGADGLFGSLTAAELGLDSRALAAEAGRQGRYALRLGYSELPRHFSDTARTPFLGVGGAILSLPAGFPADSTAAMPLDASLHPADLGYKRSRLDLGADWVGMEHWTHRVSVRHEVRDGTQRSAGSFFSSTSQLVAPVDQSTDQIELSTSYTAARWQATLAYLGSLFRNGDEALTWQNPFTAGVVGAASGQLALAPDNQFHQLLASAGYAISPAVRASAEVAVGRMTQDAPYLAATLNPALAVPALPATSLHGSARTLDASLRLTAAATERLRLSASLTHNERDNHTPSAAYPAVSTDMFLGLAPRINQPYGFTQDRLKLDAEYRGPKRLKLAGGFEHADLQRTLQEADTHEDKLWARVGAQVGENVSLALKLAHAERRNGDYVALATIDPAENPLLRKFNQADRTRDSAGLRGDFTVGEKVTVGIGIDFANDDYTRSPIGLTDGRSVDVGADVSVAVSDETQLQFFAQSEHLRSAQAGSQLFAQPDWTGRTKDVVDLLGVGVKHAALKGKLELGADLVMSRARSATAVESGGAGDPFPTATTSLDSLRLRATWRLKDNLSLLGSYWYERYDARDWRLDGVLPATVPNLLAFGEQPPRYRVNVVRLALRYRF